MKLYPNLIQVSIEALHRIFQKNEQADRTVEQLLKSNPKWGSRDRRFIADTIYSIVRWYRLYYENLGHEPKNEQEWWHIFGIFQILEGNKLPEWKEFDQLNPDEVVKKNEELKNIRKIRESVPDWLDDLGLQELGERWEPMLAWLNQTNQVSIRVNTLKTTPENLKKDFEKHGIELEQVGNIGFVLNKRRNLSQLKSYKRGWFEVQDLGSQLIAPFLEVEPGMVVTDACAGAGGKTMHLAALLKNEGRILALEPQKRKLKELEFRAKRAGATIIDTAPIKSNTVRSLRETADRLLLDVPCSGLGVLRRNPDSKWKLNPEFLAVVKAKQKQILEEYSSICKVGGQLVYATCSILPSENEHQITSFLESPDGQGFELIQDKYVIPDKLGFDGFYMARLKRKS